MRRIGFRNSLTLAGAALALASVVAPPVRAQDPDDLKRGVARISLMNGDVNVRRGDSGEWVAGVINAPLMTDDRVATGPASRAEVQFDASNLMRIGANGEIHLAQLEYGRYQIELAKGLSTFRILRQSDVNIEIDTPSVSIRPSKQGSVRILVNDAGETEVTARNGDVEIFTPRGSQWVRSGQTLLARGSSSDPEFQVVAAGAEDDWDRWSDTRDRVLKQSRVHGTWVRACMAPKIWTTTEPGKAHRITGMSGVRRWLRTGHPTITGVGPGLIGMAGPG